MVRLVGEVRPSGYELDDQTLSLDDSIALTRVGPPKSTKNDRVLDASWTLGRSLPTGRLSTAKGGVLVALQPHCDGIHQVACPELI